MTKKMKIKDYIKEFDIVTEEFLNLDHEHKIANVNLEYDKPSDIFDNNLNSKTKLLNDDFIDWLHFIIQSTPRKYKVDIHIKFNDTEGYNEEFLQTTFKKNHVFEIKRLHNIETDKKKLAFSLIGIGVIFFVAMITIKMLWNSQSLVHEIFFYVFDIMTTVTFWEAANILFVNGTEHRRKLLHFVRKINKVEFELNEPKK